MQTQYHTPIDTLYALAQVIKLPDDPALAQVRHEAVLAMLATTQAQPPNTRAHNQPNPISIAVESGSIAILRAIRTALEASPHPSVTLSLKGNIWTQWPRKEHVELWRFVQTHLAPEDRIRATSMGMHALFDSPHDAAELFVHPQCPIPLQSAPHVAWSNVLAATPPDHLTDRYWERVGQALGQPDAAQAAILSALQTQHADVFLDIFLRMPNAIAQLPAALQAYQPDPRHPHIWPTLLHGALASAHAQMRFHRVLRALAQETPPGTLSGAQAARFVLHSIGFLQGHKQARRAAQEARQRARGRTPGPKGGTRHPGRTP